MIPGNNSSPLRIFCIRFLRISSFTERTLYPLARNSPIVRGRVVMVIRVILLPFLGMASRHIFQDQGTDNQPVRPSMTATNAEHVEPVIILPLTKRKRKGNRWACKKPRASFYEYLPSRLLCWLYTTIGRCRVSKSGMISLERFVRGMGSG